MSKSLVNLEKAYRKVRVGDKPPTDNKLRFYTIETLSAHRAKSPEGYLICLDVPLSRTGTMIYKADEVPTTPGEDGLVTVVRYEDDVFDPISIASFVGKSVVNEHPLDENGEAVDVNPDNWRNFEVGTILHPRRGEGDKRDCVVADLIIKDPTSMNLIEEGKVQLSVGYDADYKEIKPGFARQFGIIANHVAIVQHGRCGPRCAIMDEDTLALKDFKPSGSAKMSVDQAFANLKNSLSKVGDALKDSAGNLTTDKSTTSDGNKGMTNIVDPNDTSKVLARVADSLEKLEKFLVKDRRPRRDDDDDNRSRDRRSHRRDDDDDNRSRDRHARRRDDDDDDDRRSRDDDDDDDDDDDRRSRDDRYNYTMHHSGKNDDDRRARKRDDDDDRRARKRDDDDDRRARKRDDDDAHFTDKHKRDSERELEEEAGEKHRDKVRKAKDSAILEDSWQETVSLAEILVPGVQAPRFVRDTAPETSLKTLCSFRKNVLEKVATSTEGRQLILDLNKSVMPDFSGMSCAAARSLFRDCALIVKRTNNGKSSDSAKSVFGLQMVKNPVISSPAAYNEWANKHWNDTYGYDKDATHPRIEN